MSDNLGATTETLPEGQPEATKTPVTPTIETLDAATQELISKLVESETDKRITKAVQTNQTNLQKEYEAKLEVDRKALETQKLQQDGQFKELSDQYKSELDALKAENAIKELNVQTATSLAEKELSDLIPVFGRDHSTLEARIETAESIAEIIRAKVEAEVSERLNTKSPNQSTKRQDSKLSLPEQIAAAEAKGDWSTSLALKKQM